jgi:hypothetical protein
MNDQLRLRPVGEDDLPLLYRLTSDPSATGEYEWFGWQDPGEFRRPWAENGLLSEDGGMLIVAKPACRRRGFGRPRRRTLADQLALADQFEVARWWAVAMMARQASVWPAAPWTSAPLNAAASSSPLIFPARRSLTRSSADRIRSVRR